MSVKISNVTQKYDNQQLPLFDGFSAEFSDGKIHAILGISGSGKTTLLNIVANAVKYDGKVNCGAVSYVFQNYRLIQNITVYENILVALRSVYKDKKTAKQKATDFLRLAEIEKYKDSYPDSLSGGEKQRVAIARAFAYPSEILLMDEPFASLDYGVKDRLIKQFFALNNLSARTTLFVTHNVDEALAIADEIYVLYDRPAKLEHVATITEEKSSRDIYCEKFSKIKKDLVQLLTANGEN